ncbi:hypothetical protein GQR58_030113 [Nymphon striatum]|nr:hypothetical protein GQR58_030113 [Nymphon striatum]
MRSEHEESPMVFDPNVGRSRPPRPCKRLSSWQPPEQSRDHPVHLLTTLVGQADGVVLPILQRVGVAPASLRNRLEDTLSKLPSNLWRQRATDDKSLRDVFRRRAPHRSHRRVPVHRTPAVGHDRIGRGRYRDLAGRPCRGAG